ncbi:hypothetical protein AYO46_08205 [Betaproteobacteria bacterium SCGC AG-212-J23]|nr:hypothetical protein AYO46_08205 [Betaproteobacteria bacterium SCGC AG-212-J23]
MVYIGSWKFWVIVALALGTLACAGRAERRERREQAREERRELAEQRRAERQEALERKRAERAQAQQQATEAPRQAEPAPAPTRQTAAASFAPVAVPVAAAAVAEDASSSKVIFMRVSKQASGTDAMLFDVTDAGGPKFIGTVGAATKLSYPLSAGLYTFMVVGETAEFMQANIAGGKTYYALVIPKAGAKRYAIEPVRNNEIGGKEFASWDRGTRPASGGSQAYNAADAAEKRSRHWPEWVKKSAGERAELTINTEDGR